MKRIIIKNNLITEEIDDQPETRKIDDQPETRKVEDDFYEKLFKTGQDEAKKEAVVNSIKAVAANRFVDNNLEDLVKNVVGSQIATLERLSKAFKAFEDFITGKTKNVKGFGGKMSKETDSKYGRLSKLILIDNLLNEISLEGLIDSDTLKSIDENENINYDVSGVEKQFKEVEKKHNQLKKACKEEMKKDNPQVINKLTSGLKKLV